MTTYRDPNRDLLGRYAPRWRSTHRLTCPECGQSWEVMVSDAENGPAYTEDEELTRMEAECAAELPELGPGHTLGARACRLLESADPPRGSDLGLCRHYAGKLCGSA